MITGSSLLALLVSCNRTDDPQAAFEKAQRTFIHGELAKSQREAAAGYQRFRTSHPDWASRFRVLEAESLLWRGMYEQTLDRLGPLTPTSDLTVTFLALKGAAHARLHQFPEAEAALQQGDELCHASGDAHCGAVIRARGVLALEQGRYDEATKYYARSLSFARAHDDRFLEATALLNLGAALLLEEHFAEAADWSQQAYQASVNLDAKDIAQTALGNLGWSYYKLGDSERALDLFVEAEKNAFELGDDITRVSWLTDIGYVQMDAGSLELAEQSYKRALEIARRINAQQDIFNGLRALAKVSVQSGKLDQAKQCADEATAIARQSGDRTGELYPLLVTGQIAARRGDAEQAERIFNEVKSDPKATAALIWGAQHALAQLHEQQDKKELAEREYRVALSTFEGARSQLKEDFRLPFVTNAVRIYDDYINFLIAQGKTEQALEVADYSRARTLAEGLGLLRKGGAFSPQPLNARALARHAEGTILFYWLGERQSYLWTVTSNRMSIARLAPAAEINAAVQRYRKTLLGPLDPLDSVDDAGTALYRMLVAPAALATPKDSKVYVIPDQDLNSLNFETLLVPQPKPHYWIEDVTIANASSLRMLASAPPPSTKPAQRLLLLGNPVSTDRGYPPLSNAGAEMDAVRKYFPSPATRILAGAQATPLAYLQSDPVRFGFIHFVAHGTASRLSPLDSAVVLSPGTTEVDSFKLYARDIVGHPLRAELVTISTCYGAGSRAYTGEGLVGLSWAFLRAGAHNVIGALWEVSDVSTPGLMEQMYAELAKGQPPEKALRDAKLAMLRSGGEFRRPFYWAPFQLYAGS